MQQGWASSLFDGFIGAVLGGLVSVFVAFWLVRATKAADRDLAREQAALVAAEQLQESLQELVETSLWASRNGEVENLDTSIRQWERIAALKVPALERTPIGNSMTTTLWVVRDWFTWYKSEIGKAPVDVYGNAVWRIEDFDRVWPPLKTWLTAVLANVVEWRQGVESLGALPPRPHFGSKIYDKQRTERSGKRS